MTILFLDFESYYDQDYSLSKMAPPNYILDPRWETIGCAFKADQGPSVFVDGPDIPAYLNRFDPATTTTVAFNALFDNCILAWHYGFIPTRMVCSMRLAVALRGHLLHSASLASVGKLLGVGTKGNTLASAKGLRRADLMRDPVLWAAYQDYAINDDDMNAGIFWKLMPEFPTSERRAMDRVLRCAVEPRFMVDTELLRQHLKDLKAEQVITLRLAAGMPPDDGTGSFMLGDESQMEAEIEKFAKTLRSNAKFEEVLRSHGVEVEYKESITNPDVKIPAFAKTDEFMSTLQEHDDPVVQVLACARLGLRSTIEQTRGARLLSIAELDWARYRDGNPRLYSGGTMPVPLKYSGAHTHRLSGDWKLNLQNLPAGRGTNKSKLRKSLRAPPGHKVVVADKSQIECRINAWLCGQHDLLEIFRTGGDPYSVLASAIFGFIVDKKVHLTERFIGKSGELGLGFRCGDGKFYNMVVRSARTLGMDVKKLLEVWTPLLAQQSVRTYRRTHGAIERAWFTLDNILKTAWLGVTLPVRFGPCEIGNRSGHGYVEGPGGLRMNYANPHRDPENGELYYTYGRRRRKMHGGVFLENIVQFLARIDTMNDMLRIGDRTGVPLALQSHDELVWIVPEADAQEHLRIAIEEMRRPPSWAPTLPLNAEGNFGDSYGDAK